MTNKVHSIFVVEEREREREKKKERSRGWRSK